ncbi:hypothetical protein CMV30_09980 [Nibricoccus aquaticus]|uniref:Uncharacterized protein n=1 Tax=Nibricoccus aquaticus TaxID=2576891 RepID=A0A290QDC8_9BACT|nr:hypothetical protein [Nibricoccus aquaticus]ATC64256.1 hypothetical protein CMV30_09980 [Nibricoccus aquaticus]
MEWITDHVLQIIIALAAAIAAYINNRKKAQDGEPADFDGDGIPDNRRGQYEPAGMDMEEADRTRRVQEEIRRKIAERRAGGGQQVPPLVAPRPVAPSPIPEVIRRRFEAPVAPPPLPQKMSAGAQADRDEEVLARQRGLDEQMRQLEARRAEHKRQAAQAAAPMSSSAAYQTVAVAKAGGAELLADLRAPGGARRAWILREVLGTPVGMK